MRIVKSFFNILLSIISVMIPKSKKYVVVGGWYGKRYADNSRYMYEYLCAHKEELGISKVFWFTKSEKIRDDLLNQGRDVLYGYSVRSIYWHLRSKVHIIDQNPRDILGLLSVRCIRINLWHGTPLKNFGYLEDRKNCSPPKSDSLDRLSSGGFWNDAYVAATSDYAAQLISKAMNVPMNKMLVVSYPRTIKLYNQSSMSEKQIAFYLPTFRDNKEVNPILKLDLQDIDRHLREKNIKLIVKPHFADMANWSITQDMNNIEILDASQDVYEWLDKTDLLITDYSSVYFDFLLTRKPVLFFVYDLEYYKTKDRGFAVPFDQFTPGQKVYTGSDMFDAIDFIFDHMQEYSDKYHEQYSWVLNKMHKYTDKMDVTAITDIWNT